MYTDASGKHHFNWDYYDEETGPGKKLNEEGRFNAYRAGVVKRRNTTILSFADGREAFQFALNLWWPINKRPLTELTPENYPEYFI